MYRIIPLLLCLLLTHTIYSQDIIIFTNGNEIEAKVTEVSETEVKYKIFNNQSGPTWVRKTSEVFMIRYENGTEQTLTTNRQNPPMQSQPQEEQSWYVQQSSTEEVTIPASVLFGGNICFGYNWAKSTIGDDDYKLHRWPFSFGIHLDYFGSKTLEVRANSIYKSSFGIGIDIAYSNRGGQCHLIDREYNVDWIYQVEMSFLSLRLTPYTERFGKNNSDRIRWGLGINILTSSHMRLDQLVYEDFNFAWKPLSPCMYMEMYHKFSTFSLGAFVDMSVSFYEKGSLPAEYMSMLNITAGISFGLETK